MLESRSADTTDTYSIHTQAAIGWKIEGRLSAGPVHSEDRRFSSNLLLRKARRKGSRRAFGNLTKLEFKAQIRLEYVVRIDRIDTDIAVSTGAERTVDSVGMGVGKL